MIHISANAIGVDISTSSVKVATIKKGRKGLELNSFAEEKIPVSALVAGVIRQPDNVKDALEKVISRLGIRKGEPIYAVCTIPDDKVYMQETEFPKLEYKKLKEAIQFKIQTFIPLPLTDVYWDFLIIKENENQTYNVLVSAASKETVDSYYSVLKSAGIIPIRFESSSMSANRVLSPDPNGVLFLDIGRTQTTVSLSQDSVIKFTSTVHMGINQLIKAYDDFFMIDDDKSIQLLNESGIDLKNAGILSKLEEIFAPLTKEISRTLNFQNKVSLKTVYCFGEGATVKNISHLLIESPDAQTFPIESPFKNSKVSIDFLKSIPAIGATLQNTDKMYEKDINFIPEIAAKQVTQKIVIAKVFQLLRITMINLLAYAVIFFLFGLFLIGIQSYENQKLQITESNIATMNYAKQNTIISGYNDDLQKISNAQGSLIDWMPVLKEIPSIAPTGIVLTSYNISKAQPGWNVTISGQAGTRDELLEYAHNLETKSHYLQQVILPIQYLQTDKNVTFTINAVILSLQ